MIKGAIILLSISSAVWAAVRPATNTPGRPWEGLTGKPQKQGSVPQESNDIGQYYGFGEMETIKLDYGIQNLLIADFDGDGRNDIAVANNSKARIELLMQKQEAGLEEEDVAVDPNDVDINALIGPSRFHKQTVPVSQRIYSMAAGDLDSDGLADLVFYGEPRGLYVLLQKPHEEKGQKQKDLSWQPRKRVNIDDALPSENALVCADIDNDGRLDLILASRQAVYIVLQKNDGTLAEPVKYASAARILGVDAGDLNGDGKNDLVVFTDELERPIHVRLGQKNNQLGPEIRLFVERPLAAELTDIDGAAGQELVTIDAVSKRLICYKLTSEGPKEDDWPVLFYPLAAGEASNKRDLVIGDVDGDGLTDVVVSDPGAAEIILYRQSADVGLEEPARFPSLADTDGLSAADIDGDGKSEIGVLSVKEKVIGISKFETQRLSFPHAVDLAGEPLAMELSDIDGDGAIDCVYVARSQTDTRSLRVNYNVAESAGQSDANNPPAAELNRLNANPQGIRVIDVDRDGLKDVLIFVKYELPILVRQTDKRTFEVVDSPKAQASLIKEATPRSIGPADIDGSPGEELLLAQNNFARSMVFTKGGWTVLDQYNAKSSENRISAAAASHIDGDKPAILLLDGQKGRLQILSAGADKTYRFDRELDIGTWNTSAGIKMMLASLTADRSENIVLFDGEKFAIVIPPASDTTVPRLEQDFSYETKIKDGSYGGLTTGDINGDGIVDIIMVEYKHNHIEILSLDSAGKPVPAFAFKVFEDKHYRQAMPQQATGVEPRQLKVADVTGDGSADLVTIIHDRVIVYPQD
ncbi:MAG: VCBS repeat-containing protein [Planctomycetota bacterium]